MSLGATLQEWQHFANQLALSNDLLPIVPDVDGRVAPNSKLRKLGKTPSVYNAEGEVRGIVDWTTRTITAQEIARWSEDRRLSICVRASAVRAVDVDITDDLLADVVGARIEAYVASLSIDQFDELLEVPALPKRARANSSKFLCAFRLQGSYSKRIIYLENGQRIEFLANGQQFVIAGAHESGTRYEWVGGLPDSIPELTLEQFEGLWALLETFGTAETPKAVSNSQNTDEATLTEIDDTTAADLTEALQYAPLVQAAESNDIWSEIGYALLSLGTVKGFEAWCTFSRTAPSYQPGAPEAWWDAHNSQIPRTDYRHIFTMARALGWRARAPITADDFPVEATISEVLTFIPDAPERPILRLRSGQLHAYALQAESILHPDLYTQGGMLARIGIAKEAIDDIQRGAEQQIILRVTSEYVQRRLTQLAQIQKYVKNEGAWVDIDCPEPLAKNIIGQKNWPHMRPLNGIAWAPFMRTDGTICMQSGYDEQSGILYNPNAEFDAIPEVLSKDDALSALQILLKPFQEFPFATAASQSAFIAHILTEASRTAYGSTPMFWYSAPTAGTGKTLLSSMPALLVHGVDLALRPWAENNEELRKTLFASLLAGDRSIGFDNVPSGSKIRSATLCGFLTAGNSYKDRRLGASEVISVRNTATCVASGNNITPVSDMARRSLVIRLDANTPDLRKRIFKITNLRQHVLTFRPQLLVAALTILRAHILAGQHPTIALPSFEGWSKVVRDAVIWLGLEDPVMSQDDETDDEQQSAAEWLEVLATKTSFRLNEFTARDLSDACQSIADQDGTLRNALSGTGCSDVSDPIKVGYWLRDRRDVVGGGYKLIRARRSAQAQYWQVVSTLTGNEDLL